MPYRGGGGGWLIAAAGLLARQASWVGAVPAAPPAPPSGQAGLAMSSGKWGDAGRS